jgi:hypothetical protein
MPEMKPVATFFLIPLFLAGAELRLGIIGGDGAEAIAFTQILNDGSHPDHVSGARVVAAYRGGRVDKAGEELRAKWKVEITPDIGSLCRKVDGVLIAGEAHLDQLKAVAATGKPIFLVSPLAAKIEDARGIVKLAQDSGAPWFSASALRFGEISEIKASYVLSVGAWGPTSMDQRAVELLYAIMGAGCEEVSYASASHGEIVMGRWPGRTGTVSFGWPADGWGVDVARSKEAARTRYRIGQDYHSLLVEVVKFFETRQPPVSHNETLEILDFLDAAQRSKANGGAPVKLH